MELITEWSPYVLVSCMAGVQPRAEMQPTKNGGWVDKFAHDRMMAKKDGKIAELKAALLDANIKLARLEETPCPKSWRGHSFDGDGICSYCNVYDEENNLRLPRAEGRS